MSKTKKKIHYCTKVCIVRAKWMPYVVIKRYVLKRRCSGGRRCDLFCIMFHCSGEWLFSQRSAVIPRLKNTTTRKQSNSEPLREQLLGTVKKWEDRKAPTTAGLRDINGGRVISRPHRLKKAGRGSRNVAIYISRDLFLRRVVISSLPPLPPPPPPS